MKIMKKLFLASALAAAIMLTGCSANRTPDESTAEITASETDVTTASEKETETEKTTETEETEPENETEPVIGVSGKNSAGNKLFTSMSNGFIAYDKRYIKELFADLGIMERSLAADIESSDSSKYIYKFTMINDDPAEELDTGDEIFFCSTLYIGADDYFIIFGSDEYNTIEDVLPYCTENKTVEYWAYADVDEEGLITLFPLIAGSEESGYYPVIPVFAFLGLDVSKMEYPDEPLGYDYDPDSKLGEVVDGEGEFRITITDVENMDSMVRADCTVTNTYSFDAIISGKTVTVNGEDFSDDATVYFEVKSGETIKDDFFSIYDCSLHSGDVLFISAELMDSNTYEEIGEITFTFNLE